MLIHEIAEKIKKGWKKETKDGKPVVNKKKKHVGFLVAGITPSTDIIAIGFSLCSNKDDYDVVPIGDDSLVKMKVPGFGRRYAEARAMKWQDNKEISIPESIHEQLKFFINRCSTYYKDKKLPLWASQFINVDEVSSDEQLSAR